MSGAGRAVPLDVMWGLTQHWYRDRLDPEYVPPPPSHYQSLFQRAGLKGDFWALE